MRHCVKGFPTRITVSAVEIKGVDGVDMIQAEGRVHIALGVVRGLTADGLTLHFTLSGVKTAVQGKTRDIVAMLVDTCAAFALLRRISALRGIARRTAISDWEQNRIWRGENRVTEQLIPQIADLFVECENNPRVILWDHNATVAAMVNGAKAVKAMAGAL